MNFQSSSKDNMEKVLVITGQTASGKTSISKEIAKKVNGEIINGDAMQVYKELSIITDKPDKSSCLDIPHHLFDIKSIDEDYSVKEYQQNIRKVITEVTNRGHLPIIVGGTGLYIKAALYDYNFIDEDIDNEKESHRFDDLTNDELYQKLQEIDPDACNSIHPNNRKRVIRAILINKASKKTKSEIIKEQEHVLIYDAIVISLVMDKELSIQKMDERIDKMFEEGAVDEVKNNKTTKTASKAIGYPEITAYLEGKTTLEEAKELMKIHTHQYAKRQRTWQRNQMKAIFVDSKDKKKAIDEIYSIINDKWKM